MAVSSYCPRVIVCGSGAEQPHPQPRKRAFPALRRQSAAARVVNDFTLFACQDDATCLICGEKDLSNALIPETFGVYGMRVF